MPRIASYVPRYNNDPVFWYRIALPLPRIASYVPRYTNDPVFWYRIALPLSRIASYVPRYTNDPVFWYRIALPLNSDSKLCNYGISEMLQLLRLYVIYNYNNLPE